MPNFIHVQQYRGVIAKSSLLASNGSFCSLPWQRFSRQGMDPTDFFVNWIMMIDGAKFHKCPNTFIFVHRLLSVNFQAVATATRLNLKRDSFGCRDIMDVC